jgi:hypothetical protein
VVTALAAAALLALSATAVSGAPGGKAPTGKELFTTYKCTSCHSVAAEKIVKWKAPPGEAKPTAVRPGAAAKPATPAVAATASKKASDLSGIGAKKDATWLAKYLMKEEKLDEKLHKTTKFKGTPAELQTLSAWLESLKTPAKGT